MRPEINEIWKKRRKWGNKCGMNIWVEWRRHQPRSELKNNAYSAAFPLISSYSHSSLGETFVAKTARSIMVNLMFALASSVAVLSVALPLLTSYIFGGQITLFLSSPYGFKDIPDQTGTWQPHSWLCDWFLCFPRQSYIATIASFWFTATEREKLWLDSSIIR